MNITKIIKEFFKNFFAFLMGGILGIIILFVFFIKKILENVAQKAGLGIIALGPVVIIIYSFLALIIGGILGIIVLQIYKRRKK